VGVSEARRLINPNVGFGAFISAILLTTPSASPQPAKADRITIEYAAPTHPALKQVYELIKKKQALEQIREMLLPAQMAPDAQARAQGLRG
jgi:hypothetical protein